MGCLCGTHDRSSWPAPGCPGVLPPPSCLAVGQCLPKDKDTLCCLSCSAGLLVQECGGTQGSKYTRMRSLEWR